MGGMGRDFDGSYAEFAVLPKHLLRPFKSNLLWQVLCAIPEMFQTAHGSLHLVLNDSQGQTGNTALLHLAADKIVQIIRLYVKYNY